MRNFCVPKIILLLSTVLMLCSCATSKSDVSQSVNALTDSIEQNNKAENNIPDEVLDSLFSTSGSKILEIEEDRFDISVSQMPARAFFIGLVSDSGMNVVTHPEVEGAISLDLKNVTIDEVLAVTRDVYGYEFKRSNNIYSIYPRKMRTEIFEINYLDVVRKGKTNSSVLIGSISSGGGNSNQGGQLGGGTSNNSNQEESVSSGSEVETTNETNFWENLQSTVSAIVSASGEGTNVVVNPQAGLVVVTALPKEISAIRSYLERSELNVARQVILEAKIVEVKLSEGFEAGVNWAEIQGQMLLTNNVTSFSSPVDIVSFDEQAGEIFSSILRVGDMSQLISLLETQGSVQVLSSPRVSTVNNQKALIRVGSDEFFVTGISNQTTTSAAATSSTPNIELTSFFSGISLDVTPQIAKEGDVILHVHPIVSNVVDQNKNIQLGDEEFSLPLALREVRESDSIVRAKSGQVIVLGGLMKENIIDLKGKRPGLGDVPGLNLLFRTKQKTKEKTELVILLRPIVVDNNSFENDLRDTYKRIEKLSDSK